MNALLVEGCDDYCLVRVEDHPGSTVTEPDVQRLRRAPTTAIESVKANAPAAHRAAHPPRLSTVAAHPALEHGEVSPPGGWPL